MKEYEERMKKEEEEKGKKERKKKLLLSDPYDLEISAEEKEKI